MSHPLLEGWGSEPNASSDETRALCDVTIMENRLAENTLTLRQAHPGEKMAADSARLTTGVGGLDEVLRGGLVPQRAYLVRGRPGTGKSTLGAHFVAAGRERGESALFITLEETEETVRRDAAALGIDLKGVAFLDLSTGSDFFAAAQT